MADPISPFTPSMQAQIEQLLQGSINRSTDANPVHQAAMAMAMRMAPGYARTAVSAGAPASAPGSLTPSSGGSSAPGLGTTAAVATFAALLKNPSFLAALKGLFGNGSWSPDGTFTGPSTVTDPTGGSPLKVGGPSSGPMGGPSPTGGPNTVGTPFDISNQGGPTDVRAVGTDQIQQLLRMMGGNPAGSGGPYDGLGNGGPGNI